MATSAKRSVNPVEVKVVKGSAKVSKARPDVEVKTGLTGGKKYMIKINQPSGKSVLIAVHL